MNSESSDLHVAATGTSPEVDLRFSEHRLALKGESYPENAAAFYGDLVARVRAYLAGLAGGGEVTFDVALTYFNSSSTKMLFALFDTAQRERLFGNIARHINGVPQEIVARAVEHFRRIDPAYAEGVIAAMAALADGGKK